MNLYNILHYYIVPPFFILTTPLFVQYLATIGHDKEFLLHDSLINVLGNYVTWTMMLIVSLWALIGLKIPSRKTYGPITSNNTRPEYQDNGFIYYVATVAAFAGLQYSFPSLSNTIFWNMPLLIGTLNIAAFLLCIYLFFKGTIAPEAPVEDANLPRLFLFYRGVELHPRLFGVNVKQLTNCRFGLILWQLLVSAFCATGYQLHGFNPGASINFLLQTVYLVKFYWWEAGYFWTLDMALDHAGYYICWGCMVFVPMFYTYSSYYFVLHPPTMSTLWTIAWLVFGAASIGMNYRADYEKQAFQKCPDANEFKLYNSKVEFIPATYSDAEGNVHESKLLVSGCWGVARHLNYLFELLLALAWSMPGYGLGVHAFLYPIFLTGLLVHRCYRDEKKCREKYGAAYDEYCKRVPYRIVPYIF